MQNYWNFELKDKIGVLTYIHPPKNFLNMESMEELDNILEKINALEDVRCIVVRSGIDGVFISGADFNIFNDSNIKNVINFVEKSRMTLRKLENFPIPVIALVNGVCLGGGNEFALCCDIRVSGKDSIFGQPEVIYGLIPGGGGTQRIARITNKNIALKLLLTGFTIHSDEAYSIGLIDEVVENDKVFKTGMKYAKRIAGLSPLTVQNIKDVVLKGQDVNFNKGLEIEFNSFIKILHSEDLKEGMDSFKNKRRPVYKGK